MRPRTSGVLQFHQCEMSFSRKRERVEQTSHKVIEKRRRDRINNCLFELSQTVPAAFSKQTSGKLEKAEILEMTVEYLRAVQTTEIGMRFDSGEWFSTDIWRDFAQHYHTGYSECVREVLKYMADVEGIGVTDTRCARMLSFLHNRFRSDVASGGNGSSVSSGSTGSGSPTLGSFGTSKGSFLNGCAKGMASSPASSRELTVLNSVKTIPSPLSGSSAFDTPRVMGPPSYLSPSVSSSSDLGDGIRSPLHPTSSLPSLNVVPSAPFRPLPALSIPAVDYLRYPPTANFMCSRGSSVLGPPGMVACKDALSASALHPGLALPTTAHVRKDTCSSV